ncbi:Ldh family oxidoreductase [Ahrensia sp. R2A130]|uniref:Ldh family oxidoreductase n=1 Tax=Ahrensia sp. R2A130 TaxID=744979 RepID=UPI0001E0AC4B|nr:Ldh family oxidoreductase [Ahrensia sp. R2A130]EFL90103.1 L-sulfolactate dehydrogenase [Ahrensia sp. R2A130]
MSRKLSPAELRDFVAGIFMRCNTSELNARSVASALVEAELAGQTGHGLRRVESYAAQAQSGKVDGNATPKLTRTAPGTLSVDVAKGYAYPALDMALEQLPAMAKEQGIAAAGFHNSHHCGVAGVIVEKMASQGLVALLFANTPAAMAPWGGSQATFGTNPIAFAAPRSNGDAVVVDVSLSKVARGKLMAAKQKGDAIPEGWALGQDGQATTDAATGLSGTMVPLGDAKGTALALMVEILAACLTGANTAANATSFFDAEGESPGVGQFLIVIDPDKIGGPGATDRIAALTASIESQDGARVPGARRSALRADMEADGIAVDDDLFATLDAIGR